MTNSLFGGEELQLAGQDCPAFYSPFDLSRFVGRKAEFSLN